MAALKLWKMLPPPTSSESQTRAYSAPSIPLSLEHALIHFLFTHRLELAMRFKAQPSKGVSDKSESKTKRPPSVASSSSSSASSSASNPATASASSSSSSSSSTSFSSVRSAAPKVEDQILSALPDRDLRSDAKRIALKAAQNIQSAARDQLRRMAKAAELLVP
jgi:hypothetical protein